jgi:hypothetical protein
VVFRIARVKPFNSGDSQRGSLRVHPADLSVGSSRP